MFTALRDFLKLETAGGFILMIAAAAAMIVANSPLEHWYAMFVDLPVEIRIGTFEIAKPLLLWINDGLMAVFFLLIGLELKREVCAGELSDLSQIALPALGAFGGMVLPALIYFLINQNDPVALQGWAIPAATDIAFALAIIALLGKQVPLALRVFLVSVAIFDDIGAIVIITLFYTSELSTTALTVAALCLPALFLLNRRGVREKAPYLLVGLVMWAAVLKSGVHATLAGVVLAMFIPMGGKGDEDADKHGGSPLCELEHDLHTAVAFGILPLFAFANAGIPLLGVTFDALLHPVPLGIIAGLFIGKQLGVFLFCWLGVKLKLASLPTGFGWLHLYGAALLCGVGFTMSLFIASLAFEQTVVDTLFNDRLGIIVGSLLSGVAGYMVLRLAIRKDVAQET